MFAVLTLLGFVCEYGNDVLFDNRTSAAVQVCSTLILGQSEGDEDDPCDATIAAGKIQRAIVTTGEPTDGNRTEHIFVIRDVAGKFLDRERFTWHQLQAQDFIVVVTEDGIVPPK